MPAVLVKGADGVFRPLHTFYWSFGLPPGTDLSKEKSWQPIDITPVRDCGKGPCDTGEPGFAKFNDPLGDSCNSVAHDAWDATPADGPATFSINCGT